jgi:outer membrane protein OmpA-like peptidoglycan-associated protein
MTSLDVPGMRDRTTNAERENESKLGGRRRGHQQSSPTAPRNPVSALHRMMGNQTIKRLHENGDLQGKSTKSSPSRSGSTSYSPASVAESEPPNDVEKPRCVSGSDSVHAPETTSKSDRSATAGAPEDGRRQRLSNPHTIQPKLTVSEPDDRYEKEAERVAERVMRMPAPATVVDTQERPPAEGIQRMCSRCRRRFRAGKPLNCEDCEAELQRQPSSPETPSVTDGLQRRIQTLRGGGKPLPEPARSFFEPRFGRDFGDVRVHTGGTADELARAVDAEAFTIGRDVVFRSGTYRPNTQSGKQLLAHELTHTVQQTKGDRPPAIQRYVRCLSPDEEACDRNSGEERRSEIMPMRVEYVSGPVSGLLVSNFAIGGSDIKTDLEQYSNWTDFVGQMESNLNTRWEILGFSDCTGGRSTNEEIRAQRARAVHETLPPRARSQVDAVEAAPMVRCMDSDANEEGRVHNRSAFIRQTVTSYEFEPEEIKPEEAEPDPSSKYVACYDGTTVYVRKNSRFHQCTAVTGSVGGPTPNGEYCIREQGEAQLGRTIFHPFRDHSDWYLLEPQFSKTRSRLHLHPGTASACCVTVTDESCFSDLASILNSSGRITRPGYDGYPPGNDEGVDNPEESKTCVGLLLVKRTEEGCRFMLSSSPNE